MTPADRIEELEAEVHYLRSELRRLHEADRALSLRAEFGVGPTEAAILLAFWAAKGRILTAEHIYSYLPLSRWDGDLLPVRVYVCKLRKKVGADCILTVKGQGYCLTLRGMVAIEAAFDPWKADKKEEGCDPLPSQTP
jgi:DNA-binding response OmpR family regulator